MKRQRGRSRRSNTGNNSNRSIESNGPEVKVRGTAKQIFEKYETLARDAAVGSNRVKAENLRQHAEHYLRIVNAHERVKQAQREETASNNADNTQNSTGQNSAGKPTNASGTGASDEGAQADQASGGKRGRRYPPQTRRSNGADKANTDKPKTEPADEQPAEAATPEGLEVVKPETAKAKKPAADTASETTASAKKPTRRRKAPSKDEAAASDDATARAKPAEAAS